MAASPYSLLHISGLCMYRAEYFLKLNLCIIIIIIIIIVISCNRPFLPGTSLEPAVIPTAQAASFTLQHFPQYVCRAQYGCFLQFLDFVLSWFVALLLLLLLLLYDMDVSCHKPFLPGTSLEPTVIPIAQASSFTLQSFPYYV